MATLIMAKSQCMEFSQALATNTSTTRSGLSHLSFSGWRPPRNDVTKIITDTAFDKTTGRGCAGIVCRNEKGQVLTVAAIRIFVSSALVAEALALREALQFGRSIHLQHVIVESDNMTLVEDCKEMKEIREIQNILHDIKFLKSGFMNCGFTWVKRIGNKVANQIVALGNRSVI